MVIDKMNLPSIDQMINGLIKIGFKEQQISNSSGISQGTISKLRTKRIDPKFSTYQKIFNFYNSVDECCENNVVS